MNRIGTWWNGSGWLARIAVIGLGLLGALAIVGGIGAWWLLTPSVDVDDYAAYYVDEDAPLAPGEVAVTFFGVSSLLFDDGETQILIDAFFNRPTLFQNLFGGISSDPATVAQFVADYDISRLAAVFMAHSHVDHALDVGPVGEQTGAIISGTESTLNIGRGAGLPESQLLLAEPGDVVEYGDFTIQILDSIHSDVPGTTGHAEPELITEPLQQPTNNAGFAEGGALDFVITHGDQTFVVKASANYLPDALNGIDADVLYVASTFLAAQEPAFQSAFLDETIGTTSPEIVVPLHWDDFLRPWAEGDARFNPRVIDATAADGFDMFLERSAADGAEFVLLQAGSRMVLEP